MIKGIILLCIFATCSAQLTLGPSACNSTCDVNAECVLLDKALVCRCNEGFIGNGTNCISEIEPSACDETCDVNAECISLNETSECVCNEGFNGNGMFCEAEPESPCIEPCDENAECLNGTSNCECKEGYLGNGTYCEPEGVHESSCIETCDVNAECVALNETNNCECKEGFVGNGTFCEPELDFTNFFLTKPPSCNKTCDINAECVLLNETSNCQCKEGYTGNGTYCEPELEVPYCNEACVVNAECVLLNGTSVCQCTEGYIGNGTDCSPELVLEPSCDEACDVNAECISLNETNECKCKESFAGNGTYCEAEPDPSCNEACDVNADCISLNETNECRCKEGFVGNGTYCETEPEPSCNEICDVNAECISLNECECKEGYAGNGTFCEPQSVSGTMCVCVENAECREMNGSIGCQCTEGFIRNGSFCEIKCKNGGELVGEDCVCKPGFDGERCEIDILEEKRKFGSKIFDCFSPKNADSGSAASPEKTCKNPEQISFNNECVFHQEFYGEFDYVVGHKDVKTMKNNFAECAIPTILNDPQSIIKVNVTNISEKVDEPSKAQFTVYTTGSGSLSNLKNAFLKERFPDDFQIFDASFSRVFHCKEGTNYCDRNATCTETEGFYTCACKFGYVNIAEAGHRSGTKCRHTCKDENNKNYCMNGGMCSITVEGNGICRCPENYAGDRCEREWHIFLNATVGLTAAFGLFIIIIVFVIIMILARQRLKHGSKCDLVDKESNSVNGEFNTVQETTEIKGISNPYVSSDEGITIATKVDDEVGIEDDRL